LKAALQRAMALDTRTNQYVTEQEPWRLVNADQIRAATVIYVALQTVDYLKTLFSPFLPFSSQRLHEFLGYDGVISPQPRIEDGILTGSYLTDATWEPRTLPIGQTLRQPSALFAPV